jgi:histidinol dehydrogenase
METIKYPGKTSWAEILRRPVMNNTDIDALVQPIINKVREQGDRALISYALQFDKVELTALEVTDNEFIIAEQQIDQELKEAISLASQNIEAFHVAQRTKTSIINTADGVECWQRSIPIEKVGLYIPGGSAPLFSTVLMLAIPARIAGCTEIVLCTPPSKKGMIHPAILYAAKVTGVTRVFKAGGAQAIAAMAFGTQTIPSVYKIFGPGNQYVTAAKQLVSRSNVAIDMPAGPSEVAVIADETSNPVFVASDLLSQAEHGTDSQVLLFTTSEKAAAACVEEVKKQVEFLPRKNIALGSLEHSRIIVLRSRDEMMNMVNTYAPEHLIISTDDADDLEAKVINAGSVFLGHYSTESAGDYASGTNHTLPTNGHAKAYNGINLDSFVKKITFQRISKKGLEKIGPAIMKMARTEELMAHSNAVSLRIK